MNSISTQSATAWVEETLSRMSLEECVGHLICPEDRNYTIEEWEALASEIPLGSVFFGPNTPERFKACTAAIQKHSRIPVLVASDLEHGAGCMVKGGVDFPWTMALGVADDTTLAHTMGRASAVEGRAAGIHWTFGPVVDLSINPESPVVNIRALGDDPDKVSKLAIAWIEGMQQNGSLAATAKHFPGDGMDDRDQHLCTSVNSMTMEEWRKTYGVVWKRVIDAGVMSIMCGHIALPAYENLPTTSQDGMPATLSRKLQVDLLRNELGFEGVIVSDAAPMIGMCSRVHPDDQAIENILTGSDVFLFADPRNDFKRLLAAVRSGRLPEKQVRESTKRVLVMKAKLGLHIPENERAVTPDEVKEFQRASIAIAEKSITLLRRNENTPTTLKPGAKVLTATIKYAHAAEHIASELAIVDEELKKRGYDVTHWLNPSHNQLLRDTKEFDALFINLVVPPHSSMGTIRMTGDVIMTFWRAFWQSHPRVIFTTFANPFVLRELPHIPNLYATYSPVADSQRAAVNAWLGEIPVRE